MSNIARPNEYEEAIRSKERAREDIEVRHISISNTVFLLLNVPVYDANHERDTFILTTLTVKGSSTIIRQLFSMNINVKNINKYVNAHFMRECKKFIRINVVLAFLMAFYQMTRKNMSHYIFVLSFKSGWINCIVMVFLFHVNCKYIFEKSMSLCVAFNDLVISTFL